MDRFSNLMIGICICVCLGVLIIFFITTSVYLINLNGSEETFTVPVTVREPVRPQRAVGGGVAVAPSNTGNQETDDDALAANGQTATGKTLPGVPDPGHLDSAANGDNGTIRISPFARLTDSQKNACWWDIAKSAKRSGEDKMTFTLTIDNLGHLSRKYDCTHEELVRFFREGSDAQWLRLESDPDK